MEHTRADGDRELAVTRAVDPSDGARERAAEAGTLDLLDGGQRRIGRHAADGRRGVEQPGEVGGTIFSPDNVQGNKVRYANMTFGQGVSVTMVQMAAAFSATVNGGTYYQPTLIDGTLDQDGKETANQSKVVSDNVISDSASSNIRKMMFEARRGSWPTADGGYYVGSKTGTAQIYDDATKTYSKDRTTGTTIGFGADKDGNAQYVIMVRIEYSGKQGFAGSVAANPVFTKMSNWLAQYEGITKP